MAETQEPSHCFASKGKASLNLDLKPYETSMSVTNFIHKSPIANVVTNPRLVDNPIVDCNNAFTSLTGYSRLEVIGRNCRFMAGAASEPWQTARIRTALEKRCPVAVTFLNYRKNGSAFRNAVLITPLFDESGNILFFIGSLVDVSESNPTDLSRLSGTQHSKIKVENLNARHQAILMKMATGRLNKQIAWDLKLSERTVKMHRAELFKRLGVSTAADAIRIATEAGAFDEEGDND